jgi:hypothetical protein
MSDTVPSQLKNHEGPKPEAEAPPRHTVNQCWGSVTFWCGSVLLTNDPTPFFSDFKNAKIVFFIFLFLQLNSRHIIFRLKN